MTGIAEASAPPRSAPHLDRSLGLQMLVEDAAAILSARKIATARYIFVRAVVELLQVTQKDDLGEEQGMTIEVNAFNAYRSESLDVDVQSPHKRAYRNFRWTCSANCHVQGKFTRRVCGLASDLPDFSP